MRVDLCSLKYRAAPWGAVVRKRLWFSKDKVNALGTRQQPPIPERYERLLPCSVVCQ
ncbi:hypothetical protein KVC_0219 [Ketogulonicigenium vulgare]|nr:hypothetical protein KVC_0219 [Ketogulonicigenium vulgare]